MILYVTKMPINVYNAVVYGIKIIRSRIVDFIQQVKKYYMKTFMAIHNAC